MRAPDPLASRRAHDFARGLVKGALHEASVANEARPPVVCTAATVLSPLDAWWSVQDLMWRSHARRALVVPPAIGSPAVWLPSDHSFGAVDDHRALLDPATDAWFDGTRVRHLIEYRSLSRGGTTLHFTPIQQIDRWSDGAASRDQFTAFFHQLSRTNHDHPYI